MLIKNINLQNVRGIKNVVCEHVPKLMIIAGPNGSGKSTLLYQLKQQNGERVIYIGPHRQTRRQNVSYRSLFSQDISMEEMLMKGQVDKQIEGLTITDRSRDAWGADEALNYLKHGLCQIEIKRKNAIATLFDREGEIPKNAIPDLWEPLKELTNNLLPHLRFKGIDVSNQNGIKCLWEVHSKGIVVDIDELSSGEKAVIQIFYPLIEHRIKHSLDKLIVGESTIKKEFKVTVLIDEPELHPSSKFAAKST